VRGWELQAENLAIGNLETGKASPDGQEWSVPNYLFLKL
jgi:hypothetical protein